MTRPGKSSLRKFIAATLAAQNTHLEDLLDEVLEGNKSGEDTAFEIRRRTGVEVSTATIHRWAKAMRGTS